MKGFGNWFKPMKSTAAKNRRPRLELEVLEAREVPTVGISGYAFDDLNGNGLRDPGELPIANSTILLLNSANQVIGTTTTDATGFYRFLTDDTAPPAQQSLTQNLVFGPSSTNVPISHLLAGFNPAWGTLQAIEISINGQITSQIRAENLDPVAATIHGNVEGTILLTGPGVWLSTITSTDVQSFSASPYDGVMDFAGGSGVTFSARTAAGANAIHISDSATLAGFITTGDVQLVVTPQASSNASGGGNLLAQISSSGGAEVSVTYHYLGANALAAGNYRVVQPNGPAGYLDGRLSRDGQILPWPNGSRSISVQFNGQTEAGENNFASLRAGEISGTVYIDANNDALWQPIEVGVAGVRITLTGTNDRGQRINLTAVTNANGAFTFTGLRPGDYDLTQATVRGLLPGRVNAPGSLGGNAQVNRFQQVSIGSGSTGTDYNFAWLKGASLSGFVYFDRNLDGIFNAGDRGIQRLVVTLTGVDDLGNLVQRTTRTNGAGYYEFANLRPGVYEVTQTQAPNGWQRGALNLGSAGGITATNAMTDIFLNVGDLGRDYNFAFQSLGSSKANLLGSTWRPRA